VLHSIDDPIATWRGIAANEGFLHPEALVRSGQGNVLLLLTERGGHVGWPTGMLPFQHGWEFMSEAAASFVNAVGKARQHVQDDSRKDLDPSIESLTCSLSDVGQNPNQSAELHENSTELPQELACFTSAS
jgi:hypothetical protein